MTIGQLAERVGVTPQAIRYYESIGLLPEAERRPSGYRDYGESDVSRVAFVRAAQRLGLALAEIGEILRFRERGERPCDYVLGVLDRQVDDLDRQMAEMAQLRSDLTSLKENADRLSRDEACYCAVIEHARDPLAPPAIVRRTVSSGSHSRRNSTLPSSRPTG